jgi:D-alanyl-D-alanine carboxypeptidase (penicillin-binding protein 5/6)
MPAPAGAQQLPAPKATILVDANSGRILSAHNIHERLHPASTAKIMTALTAVERLAPDAIVQAHPNTANVQANKIGFPATARWTLEQMIAALMMVSANDAGYAIAHTAGGLDAFANAMNATAVRLGMKETTLNDPAGLDDGTSYLGGPVTSAYDLAIATRNAMQVPVIAKYAGLRQYSFKDPQGVQHWFTNHNKMLPGATYATEGTNGFKTGFTRRAQHSLVTTATRNGRTLIVAILGSPLAGYAVSQALLAAGFAMPADAAGTGETLPPVVVSPYASRAADRDAFAQLATAPAAGSKIAGTGITVPDSIPVLDALPRAAPAASTRAADASADDGGGPGWLRPRNFLIVVFLLLMTAFLLRRRAVRRERARRLARRRQRAVAMRSGRLPVVDGRYRAGTRVGPPVESHVRVRRGDERRRSTG